MDFWTVTLTDTAQRILLLATPLYLATLGEILTERAGILNLGMEGLIAIGALVGFAGALATGNPWVGILLSLMGGALLASLHALVSVTLRANQVVSGLALTMIGLGAAQLFGMPMLGKPLPQKLETINIPFFSDIPFLGPILFKQDIFFYLSIFLGFGMWFFLKHTLWGVRLRSVGENPKAADTQGVQVAAIRYAAVMIGGALAALAGSQLALSYTASWTNGLSAGRGWIVIALTIFALWNPLRALGGAILFGGFFVLKPVLAPLGISENLLGTLPYLATLGFMLLAGLRKNSRSMFAPGMLGEPFKRGER